MFKFVLSVLILPSAQAATALSYTVEFTGAEIQQRVSAMKPFFD